MYSAFLSEIAPSYKSRKFGGFGSQGVTCARTVRADGSQLFMPVTQKMMICSSSSFVSLSSDKLRHPKLEDKEFPAGTARPQQERRQETTTAAPTLNCMSANCPAWRDSCSSLSFPAYKGIKNRAAKLVKLDEEIGVISLPSV